jgi:hypothetical protein
MAMTLPLKHIPAMTSAERQFRARVLCVLIACPITLLAFMPVLLQAAEI